MTRVADAIWRACRSPLRRDRSIDLLRCLQVTRGIAPRGHVLAEGVLPALVVTVRRGRPSAAEREAAAGGCREAWLLDRDDMVAEGGASSAYIVDGDGRLVTQPLSERILGRITRATLLELARQDVVDAPLAMAGPALSCAA